VITGFNTDIEHDGVVYHVQTEDKGPTTPFILSLVYDRGTILASKRVPYGEENGGPVDETALAERLQRQHKLICAAVHAGRLEELIKMTSKNGGAAKRSQRVEKEGSAKISAAPAVLEPQVEVAVREPSEEVKEPDTGADLPETENRLLPEFDIDISGLDFPIPKPEIFQPVVQPAIQLPILEEVSIVEDTPILPIDDIEVISALAGVSRPEHDNLGIEFVGDSSFRCGDRKMVSLLVCRGSRREVVRGAEIMVKILGTSFRPVISHATSDRNGLATLHLQIPQFNSGRAIVLARAINNGEEVEVRRPLTAAA
jgi:hypothetical protein